jgi:hypothetical protein
MRNWILKNGILIMAGALALGACGGRDKQRPPAQPEYTEPAPPPLREGQGTAEQDRTATPAPDQDRAGTPVPGQERTEPAPDMAPSPPAAAGPCPTDVQGTVANMEETPEGIAITFTTAGDVAAVRLRVQRLADLHNQRHAERMQVIMHEQTAQQQAGDKTRKAGARGKADKKKARKGKAGTQREADQADQAGTPGVPDAPDVIVMTQTRVEETPGGARLVFTVVDPADIEDMREPLRAHSEVMAGAQCDPISDPTSDPTGSTPPGATSQRSPRPPRPR